jgi:hypothetical protein
MWVPLYINVSILTAPFVLPIYEFILIIFIVMCVQIDMALSHNLFIIFTKDHI